MQIAPGTDAAAWKKLDLDNVGDWETAVSISERRIRGRFTDAIEFLIGDDERRPATERRWGFAVLTLDCLLVETLQAFRRGLTATRNKSRELCVQFLTERTAFKPFSLRKTLRRASTTNSAAGLPTTPRSLETA